LLVVHSKYKALDQYLDLATARSISDPTAPTH
jgi:hypothetical protein